MVDSTTQTSDELLEDLLLQKLQEAYERRQAEQVRGKKTVELDFERV